MPASPEVSRRLAKLSNSEAWFRLGYDDRDIVREDAERAKSMDDVSAITKQFVEAAEAELKADADRKAARLK